MRRQAWDTYRQTLDEQRKRLITQAVAGMTGDTISSSAQASSTAAPASPQPSVDPGQAAFAGMPPGWAMPQPAPRQEFWNARQNPDYQPDIVTKPVSPYEIKAGDTIEAVLINGLNSDTKGQIVAQVTKPVLDYATGTHILIPQGARLIGYYNTDVAYGQDRLEAGFDRVISRRPAAKAFGLVRTPGSDQEGYAGFHDITENHLGRIIFNALLGAVFSAGIQLSQPCPARSALTARGRSRPALSASKQTRLATSSSGAASISRRPRKVRNGYHFTILVKQDIAFSPVAALARAGFRPDQAHRCQSRRGARNKMAGGERCLLLATTTIAGPRSRSRRQRRNSSRGGSTIIRFSGIR